MPRIFNIVQTPTMNLILMWSTFIKEHAFYIYLPLKFTHIHMHTNLEKS